MRMRVVALVGTGVLGAILGPTVAYARDTPVAACTTVVHRDLGTVKTDNDNDGTATNAKVTLLGQGVEVTTPDDAAKAYARFPADVALSTVTSMAYDTYKYASSTDTTVVPAYEIEVFLSGHAGTTDDPLPDGWAGSNYTTLVFEPYQAEGNAAIQEGIWQSWDADQGGAAKWWSTHALTAITGDTGQATPETWSSILAAYPNARGIDYDINQGANNTGAVTAFNNVTFGTAAGCTTQQWTDVPAVVPQPSPSASTTTPASTGYPGKGTSGTTSPSPTTKPGTGYGTPTAPAPTPSPTVVPTTVAADTSLGGLALTGPDFIVPAGFGLLLTVTGAILFRIARRRRHMMY